MRADDFIVTNDSDKDPKLPSREGSHIDQGTPTRDSFSTRITTEGSFNKNMFNRPSLVNSKASDNNASPFDQAALDKTLSLQHLIGDSKADQHGVDEITDVIEYLDLLLAHDQYFIPEIEVCVSVHFIVFDESLVSLILFNQDTSKYNDMSLVKASTSDAIVLRGTEEISVKEEEEIVFLLPFLTTAVVVDAVFNEGKVVQQIADDVVEFAAHAMDYLAVLDEILAEFFKDLSQKIYDWLKLEKWDDMVKDWVVGTKAGIVDEIVPTAMAHLGPTFDKMREIFEDIQDYMGVIRDGLDLIGASDFITRYIGPSSSVHEQLELDESDDKTNSCTLEQFGKALGFGEGPRILNKMKGLIRQVFESLNTGASSNAMDSIIDCLKELSAVITAPARCWLESLEGLGSIQFIVNMDAKFIVGIDVEIGLSIDVGQYLYFLTHGFNFDPSFTQIMSLHVGYAISYGIQIGAGAGMSIAYHTSRVTGVGGFGWGLSLEGAAGYKIGAAVAWPIPGSHVPNQYLVTPVGAGADLSFAAFLGHSVSQLQKDSEFLCTIPLPFKQFCHISY